MILLIDNYDSFSYNLYQLVGEIDSCIKVIRNDEMTVEEILSIRPDRIIISPGPGRPVDAGIIIDLVKVVSDIPMDIPILGVCLGHQAICEAFGGEITYAKKLMHGKQSEIRLDVNTPIFSNLLERIPVARYHSLTVNSDRLPEALKIIAETYDGEVMGVKHKDKPIYGVQFHPESILTPDGKRIMENFLNQ